MSDARVIRLLPGALDSPDRLAILPVELRMLWPDDEGFRNRALDAAITDIALQNAGEVDSESWPELFKIAAASAPLAEVQEEVKKERFLRGVIVGRMLHEVLGRLSRGERTTTRECIGLAIKPFAMTRDRGLARLSIAQFNNEIWPAFRSVAHFWAAYVYRKSQKLDYPFPCAAGDFVEFLADAEAYRLKGESLRIERASSPILRSGEAVVTDPAPPPSQFEFVDPLPSATVPNHLGTDTPEKMG